MFDVSVWILIAIEVALLFLGGLVYVRDPSRIVNRSLSGFSIAWATWIAIAYLEDVGLSSSTTRVLVNLDFAVGGAIGVCFLIFCLSFPRPSFNLSKGIVALITAPAIFFAIVSFTTHSLVTGILQRPDGIEFQTGPLFAPYAGYLLIFTFVGLFELGRKAYRSNGRDRVQGEYVLLGLATSVLVIIFTNLVLPRLVETPAVVSQIGSYAIVLFIGLTVYSIIRHRLLDIRLVVARSIAYSLLLATLGSLYAAGVFLFQASLFKDNSMSIAQVLSSAALALLVAVTFQPLRRILEKLTDGIFYRDRYDPTELLQKLGRAVSSTIILDGLTKHVLSDLVAAMHLSGGAIIVQDRQNNLFIQNQSLLTKRLVLSDVESLFHHRNPLIFDELPEGHQKALLRTLDVAVALPLEGRDGVVGLLVLGAKKSGDPFSNQDLRLLGVFAPELSVGIENARAYHQIESFNETLRLQVERATRKLRDANTHLKELDKAKDEFISLASHQLRTPLTAITGYLSMVADQDVGKLNTKQKKFVNEALGGAERMGTLIDDLLNISRMEVGRFVLNRHATDLSEITGEEVRAFKPHADSCGLELIYHKPKSLPYLMIDAIKTRQVIANFIDNAIDYTKEGKVEVSIKQVGDDIELLVVDTGMGVDETDKMALFTKFFRARNAEGTRPDGNGLGLYLAKRVIEQQGGEIIFESELGKGSTFGFRLPIETSDKSISKAITPKRGSSLSHLVR
jgi:signal transduction histidine kinase